TNFWPGRDVEERPTACVVKTGNHGVRDLDGKAIVTQVSAGLACIEAGDHGEGIVVEHARDWALACLWIRVSDDVQQARSRTPALRENSIERAQSKFARCVQIQHLRSLQVRRDGQ